MRITLLTKYFAAILLLLITTSASSGTFFATDAKNIDRINTTELVNRNLDCSSAETITLSSWEEYLLEGDTNGLPDNCTIYGCSPWNESGGEYVFALNTDEDLIIHATLSSESDLDLILLSHCDPDSCLGMANQEFSAEIETGTSYLVVDGFGGASDVFSIVLETSPAGLPQEACDSATVVECNSGAIGGNLFGLPNYIEEAECGEYIERGGEQWFSVVLTDTATVTVSLNDLFFDGAIWLFRNCGTGAECVAFADAGIMEEDEELTWQNDSNSTENFYIGIDSFNIIDDASFGEYSVTIECQGIDVPTSNPSWGNMKLKFR